MGSWDPFGLPSTLLSLPLIGMTGSLEDLMDRPQGTLLITMEMIMPMPQMLLLLLLLGDQIHKMTIPIKHASSWMFVRHSIALQLSRSELQGHSRSGLSSLRKGQCASCASIVTCIL